MSLGYFTSFQSVKGGMVGIMEAGPEPELQVSLCTSNPLVESFCLSVSLALHLQNFLFNQMSPLHSELASSSEEYEAPF